MRLVGAVFVVLLCAVGLAGKAQAQFGAPTVTNVNPNTGPTSGGTSVTITGTNFFVVTAVNFGSNPAASFIVNSSSQITATSPAGTGTVDVTVTAGGGTSATNSGRPVHLCSDNTIVVAKPVELWATRDIHS
jgi:hypothetical protein